MNTIPVYVQRPCEPKSAMLVGHASDEMTVDEVAAFVGVPDGCFVGGKILRRKSDPRWSIVANVRFNNRGMNPIANNELLSALKALHEAVSLSGWVDRAAHSDDRLNRAALMDRARVAIRAEEEKRK